MICPWPIVAEGAEEVEISWKRNKGTSWPVDTVATTLANDDIKKSESVFLSLKTGLKLISSRLHFRATVTGHIHCIRSTRTEQKRERGHGHTKLGIQSSQLSWRCRDYPQQQQQQPCSCQKVQSSRLQIQRTSNNPESCCSLRCSAPSRPLHVRPSVSWFVSVQSHVSLPECFERNPHCTADDTGDTHASVCVHLKKK